MASLKKINDVKVEPLKQKAGGKPWKGHKLFSDPYSRIYLNGASGRGKTTVIYTILKHCLEPKTVVFIICPTIKEDKNWIRITDMLRDRKAESYFQTSMDAFPVMVDMIKEQVSEDSGHTKAGLKYIAILDDTGSDLRKRDVYQWLKSSRHYKTMTIMSAQGTKNLDNNSRLQISNWLLFSGLTPANLTEIYNSTSPPCLESEFVKMYKIATAQKYSFLYFDSRRIDFRRNFDEQFQIK